MSPFSSARVVRSLLHQDDVGRIVQEHYGLKGPIECHVWTVGDNDNYLLSHHGEKFFIRVYLAQKHWGASESDYRFELDFLQHLQQQGVCVAYPLPATNGEWLAPIPAPEGVRYIAVFSYAPGDVAALAQTDTQRFEAGRALACVHQAGMHFHSTHARFTLDIDFLLLAPLQRIIATGALEQHPNLLGILNKTKETILSALQTLPPNGNGVIVGDFHHSNYHFYHNHLTLFDFDLCGIGWHAHDIATWTWEARKRLGDQSAQTMLRSMMRGYESVMPFSALNRAALPALMLAREIWLAGEHCADIPSLGKARLNSHYWQAFETRLNDWLGTLSTQHWL